MIIERIDLFDFKVILVESEFNRIKAISDSEGVTIERVFRNAIETGLHTKQKEVLGKET